MQSPLLNNLCNDNELLNKLLSFTFTNFLNHVFKTSKNNLAEILTGGYPF